MGRKYYGINKDTGKRRGHYRRADFESHVIPFIKKPGRYVARHVPGRDYLMEKAICLAMTMNKYGQSMFFHYGGATVQYSELVEKEACGIKLRISLLSNDSLDDVIKKITTHFPEVELLERKDVSG